MPKNREKENNDESEGVNNQHFARAIIIGLISLVLYGLILLYLPFIEDNLINLPFIKENPKDNPIKDNRALYIMTGVTAYIMFSLGITCVLLAISETDVFLGIRNDPDAKFSTRFFAKGSVAIFLLLSFVLSGVFYISNPDETLVKLQSQLEAVNGRIESVYGKTDDNIDKYKSNVAKSHVSIKKIEKFIVNPEKIIYDALGVITKLSINSCSPNKDENEQAAWYFVKNENADGEYLSLVKLKHKPNSKKYYLHSENGENSSTIYLISDCQMNVYNENGRDVNAEKMHEYLANLIDKDKLSYIFRLGFNYSKTERKIFTTIDIGNDYLKSLKMNEEILAKKLKDHLTVSGASFWSAHFTDELISNNMFSAVLSAIPDNDQKASMLCEELISIGGTCSKEISNQQEIASEEEIRQKRVTEASDGAEEKEIYSPNG